MRSLTRLVLVISIILSTGCATIYTAPDFDDYKQTHKTVAILPFEVTITPNQKDGEAYKNELTILAEKYSKTFQQALYTEYLQGYRKGQYTVEFQDISKTNALLHAKNPSATGGYANLSKEEIGQTLGTDAVISGKMSLASPMKSGTALGLKVLTAATKHPMFVPSTPTNTGKVNISIHESVDGKLLWNYDFEGSGDVLSSAEGVAKRLIKVSRRDFPYKK